MEHVPRRLWLLCFMLGQYAGNIGGSVANQPHILFIMSDDHGWRDVGYHSSDIKTPNIDRLAKTGVRLEQHYTLMICGPSRASFLTGRYQTGHGVYQNIRTGSVAGLPLHLPTMADQMKKAGYNTYMTGKWHLGFARQAHLPWNRGFDKFYGILGGGEASHYTHRLCKRYSRHRKTVCGAQLYNNNRVVVNRRFSTDVYGGQALTYIKEHRAKLLNGTTTKPMFLFLSFTAPHSPLQSRNRYKKNYQHIRNKDRAAYSGMVTHLDAWIGRIQRYLVNTGMWNNTVLVFASDNGGTFLNQGYNYPLRGGKNTYYEGGIRTPAFVSSPLVEYPGRVHRGIIHLVDWLPTFLSLAGFSPNDLITDGVDQWRAISKGDVEPRTEMLVGLDITRVRHGTNQVDIPCDTTVRGGYRSGPWKLLTGTYSNSKMNSWVSPKKVRYARDPKTKNVRLFNIEEDPYELHDVSDFMPKKVHELCVKLHNAMKDAVKPVSNFLVSRKSMPTLHHGRWEPWM